MMRLVHFLIANMPFLLPAQTVFFHFTDGSTQDFSLENIRKLTFANDEQVLWLTDGTQYSWNVNTIGHYMFEESTGIEHIASGHVPINVHLYPNPTSFDVTFEIQLPQDSWLVVEVFDGQGRLIKELFSGERSAGLWHLKWDGAVIGTVGSYLVRFKSNYTSTTKPLIIQ